MDFVVLSRLRLSIYLTIGAFRASRTLGLSRVLWVNLQAAIVGERFREYCPQVSCVFLTLHLIHKGHHRRLILLTTI